MQEVIDFIWNNSTPIFVALFAISEVLALIPSVKSSGVFQLVYNLLVSLSKKP